MEAGKLHLVFQCLSPSRDDMILDSPPKMQTAICMEQRLRKILSLGRVILPNLQTLDSTLLCGTLSSKSTLPKNLEYGLQNLQCTSHRGCKISALCLRLCHFLAVNGVDNDRDLELNLAAGVCLAA